MNEENTKAPSLAMIALIDCAGVFMGATRHHATDSERMLTMSLARSIAAIREHIMSNEIVDVIGLTNEDVRAATEYLIALCEGLEKEKQL